jgi:hypothetical protein
MDCRDRTVRQLAGRPDALSGEWRAGRIAPGRCHRTSPACSRDRVLTAFMARSATEGRTSTSDDDGLVSWMTTPRADSERNAPRPWREPRTACFGAATKTSGEHRPRGLVLRVFCETAGSRPGRLASPSESLEQRDPERSHCICADATGVRLTLRVSPPVDHDLAEVVPVPVRGHSSGAGTEGKT